MSTRLATREDLAMASDLGTETVAALFRRRVTPLDDLATRADDVARICHAMAVRFHAGGKLVVFGNGSASTDAQHVAVEFVHPVIVGKRALPAISLTADVATLTGVARSSGLGETFAHQVRCLAGPDDIALGLSGDGDCDNVVQGLRCARELGMLTVALVGGNGGAIASGHEADHILVARSSDPRVIKEVHVTAYHVLWELVHVFFEQPGVLEPQVVAS
jgi:D-sedoheptulose 7-phosphate isomerase